MNPTKKFLGVLLTATLLAGTCSAQAAEQTSDQKIEQLEKMVQQMMQELQALKKDQAATKNVASKITPTLSDNEVKELKKLAATQTTETKSAASLSATEIKELKKIAASSEQGQFDTIFDRSSWLNRLTLGGYGDIHANFGTGDEAKDKFDLHRLVLFANYEFNDWLSFVTEVELEHASTDEEYLLVEQAYAEAQITDDFGLRLGRVLAPLGIINQKHEPTTFNGVERPLFSKYMIPSTWSLDGIGAFGNISDNLSYQLYLTGSLDGDGFSAKNGIRGGRMKGRPGLNNPAVSGRLDYYAINPTDKSNHSLRLGVSGFFGGIDNKNKGGEDGEGGTVGIVSADYEYTIGRLDLRGAIAHTKISDVSSLADGVGEEQFGYYQEVALHVMPDSWKNGKLSESDLVVFARYDNVDTQFEIAEGATEVGAADREQWTFGTSFLVTPQFVLKADYQITNDDSDGKVSDAYNLGLGFNF